jgi:hypothetical protein
MTESKRIYGELKQDIVTGQQNTRREACRKQCEESLMQMVPFRGYSIPSLTIEEYRHLRELQAAVDPAVAALAAKLR